MASFGFVVVTLLTDFIVSKTSLHYPLLCYSRKCSRKNPGVSYMASYDYNQFDAKSPVCLEESGGFCESVNSKNQLWTVNSGWFSYHPNEQIYLELKLLIYDHGLRDTDGHRFFFPFLAGKLIVACESWGMDITWTYSSLPVRTSSLLACSPMYEQ